MRRLSAARYDHLITAARLIEADGHGPKVLRTPAGTVLKVFRRKRLVSSALWSPYALRFARNAAALRARGIVSVDVRSVWHCPARARHVVAYAFLGGHSVRERAASGAMNAATWADLGAFVAHLHARGVYFRSLHPGNVLVLEHGDFGLIDIADMTVHAKALPARLRRRNFRPLLGDPLLRAEDAFEALVSGYLRATRDALSTRAHARLGRAVRAAWQRRAHQS